jgi:hypothetical protein
MVHQVHKVYVVIKVMLVFQSKVIKVNLVHKDQKVIEVRKARIVFFWNSFFYFNIKFPKDLTVKMVKRATVVKLGYKAVMVKKVTKVS